MADSLSILDRVKNRLAAQTNEQDQTQVIPDFKHSILFAEPQEQPTKNTYTQVTKTQPLKAVKLPQLELDESDFLQSTQIILPTPQFADTQVIPNRKTELASALEDATIELGKTQQTRELENEISHVSLTDEENDLNEEAETTLDSSVQKNITTKAELDKIDRELSEQKRLKSIKPAFTESERDPVKDLLDAFDSDQESDLGFGVEAQVNQSPTTSPLKENTKKPIDESDSGSDFESENVIDIISKVPETIKTAKPKRSPIDEYARKLKNSLVSSPTKESPVINLDDSEHESADNQHSEDEIPKLSKEKAFLLKQKFSKRHLANGQRAAPSSKENASSKSYDALFTHLRRANAKQLADMRNANPDLELIEEIEKEEEEMGNLLEREMERARRIRKKEKSQEKAKLALQENEDADYQEGSAIELSESDVPDSEVDSDVDSQESGSDLDDDSKPQTTNERRNRARRVVESDEEESDVNHDETVEHEDSAEHDDHSYGRNDDSYMFGGPVKTALPDHDEEDPIMHIHSDLPLPESPIDPEINHQVASIKDSSPRLFQNLAPRTPAGETSMISSDAPNESFGPIDSFQEIVPTQTSEATIATQVDNFPDQSTQVDSEMLTQINSQDSVAGKQSTDFLKKNTQVPILEDIDESQNEEDEEDEEEMKRKLALYEAKIRRKEVQSRKRRKEMERRGLKGIVDGEAEESEDEWKGVGGADMEVSDQADSEDERMIDNTLNLDLNDEEVRRKFMEQYQIKDRNELEKLIDDIQNHKLTKRARANRFDIELSDEEDEILMAYRRQKLEEQKKKLMASQKLMKNSKNEKYTAFFETIDDEMDPFILNEESESEVNHDYDECQEKSHQPSQDSKIVEKKSSKKKIVIEESFVQRQLSFLSKNDDEYAHVQEEADRQHGVEDLSVLKNRCLNSLYSRSNSNISLEDTRKRPVEDVATDEDEDESGFSKIFKKPSVVSSFKAFHEKKGVQVSTNSFSGVTVNKQYKTATGSKASITYMSKRNTKGVLPSTFKSSKLEEIERQLDLAKSHSGIGGSVSDRSFS